MLATTGFIEGLDPVSRSWFGKIIGLQFSAMNATEILTSIGGLGPITAAIVLSFRYQGMGGVRRLLARVVHLKIAPVWYLAAFSLFFLGLLAAFIELLFTGELGIRGDSLAGQMPAFAKYVIAITIFIVLEEPGWRGFMLPRLQSDYSALWSSVVAGLAWSLWHVPYFYALGFLADGISGGLTMVLIAPLTRIPVSILITWVMNSVGGSIFICMLFHAVKNSTNTIVDLESIYYLTLLYLMTLLVIWIYGKDKLSRKPKFVIN